MVNTSSLTNSSSVMNKLEIFLLIVPECFPQFVNIADRNLIAPKVYKTNTAVWHNKPGARYCLTARILFIFLCLLFITHERA